MLIKLTSLLATEPGYATLWSCNSIVLNVLLLVPGIT